MEHGKHINADRHVGRKGGRIHVMRTGNNNTSTTTSEQLTGVGKFSFPITTLHISMYRECNGRGHALTTWWIGVAMVFLFQWLIALDRCSCSDW